ncbi:MAG: endonuclease/exonuclease/phosphatase family protein [Planctomycetota bacterium]|nr:endonuclease/exonuclease/phosphatase family protein [Planctomycetota bacterium]
MRVLTWNMHKGRDARRRPVALEQIAEALAATEADVLLLQEVFHGAAHGHEGQSHALADRLGMHAAYVPNARYARGHHGNAILAREAFPLVSHRDLSTNRIERRGLLHVHVVVPGARPLNVLNTHLGLNGLQRRRQVHLIAEFVASHLPADDPWLFGGDFNDWSSRLDGYIQRRLHATNLLAEQRWRARCTYPVGSPWMPLDRLYVRDVLACDARVLGGPPWTGLSDHLPIVARLQWPIAAPRA